ncbi:carbohydrate ABC transporter permease [Actinomadura macrotermitis]|uniref:sn-glycerol-3-phosphate transport system permease protein UgpA n=1 Tax=Actinomadura macrotermitis TaxID=2585200 RepID=A0A7K0C1C8_9ACTN|nr:sugar ABC transporter permease [Actinomadura macrotermitis]MQY06882.1 sn-glycerol-3-phosphate transport system permease protein UgpA [Actinomadura macrotermitis]
MSEAGTQGAEAAAASAPRPGTAPRPGPARRLGRALAPLLWLGPSIALIGLVVLWPVVEMVRTSLLRISSSGATLGSAGAGKYTDLFADEDFWPVVLRTLGWVAGVVVVTVLLSLALGQLLNARFPGRRVVRWAVIVPWAASVLMTSLIWRWMLDNDSGLVNRVLLDLGVLDEPVNWLAHPTQAMLWMMWVAVFVSLPFTSFVILAGLQTVPGEVYEAARVDGAGTLRTYFTITLPLLRPAVLIASIINIINVFNSFPIIWAMTGGGPGHATDTTTTFMYKLAFADQDVGMSAAMAVVNFALILVLVLLYLRASRWREETR